MEESCRSGIASIGDKQERGSLRKGAYYLARSIYLKQRTQIDALIGKASSLDRKAEVSRKLVDAVSAVAKASQEDARRIFRQALQKYLAAEGGYEDAALKNSEFACQLDEMAQP